MLNPNFKGDIPICHDFPWFFYDMVNSMGFSRRKIPTPNDAKLPWSEFRIVEVMVSPEGKVFYHRKAAEEFYGKAGPVMVSRGFGMNGMMGWLIF